MPAASNRWPRVGLTPDTGDELANAAPAKEATRLPSPAGLRPQWSTSSLGHSTDITALDRYALGQHLQQCQGGSRGLRTLHNGMQLLHGFVAPRFVSTLAVVLLALGALLVLL